jgi:DNA-binding transcriptional MerR regulator
MSSEKSPTALKTIGEVAEDIDVATHVLRFWESKFHQIKPQKRRGRRYYRPEDVVIITQIKALLYGQGYTIRGVQKFLATEFKMKAADNKNTAQEQDVVQQVEVKKVLNISPNAVPFAIQMPQTQVAPPFASLRAASPQIVPNIFPASPVNHAPSVNQNTPVSITQEKPTENKPQSYNKDLFGFPIEGDAEKSEDEKKGFSNEEVEKLQHIYNGMIDMREQLKASY